MKQYEKIMGRLAEMKNDIVPSLGYSRLTEMCMFWCDNNCDPFAGITAAARETKRVDAVREILASSISAARKKIQDYQCAGAPNESWIAIVQRVPGP